MNRLGLELEKPHWAVLELLEKHCNQLTELLNSLSLDLKTAAILLKIGGGTNTDEAYIQGFGMRAGLVYIVCYMSELSNVLYVSEIPEEDEEEVVSRLKICQRKLTLLKAPVFEETTRGLFSSHMHMRPLCTLETVICRICPPADVLEYVRGIVTNPLWDDEEVRMIFCNGLDKGVDWDKEEDGVADQVLHLISEHRPAVFEKILSEADDTGNDDSLPLE